MEARGHRTLAVKLLFACRLKDGLDEDGLMRMGHSTYGHESEVAAELDSWLNDVSMLSIHSEALFSSKRSKHELLTLDEVCEVTQRLIFSYGCHSMQTAARLTEVLAASTGHSAQGLNLVEFRGHFATVLQQLQQELLARAAEAAERALFHPPVEEAPPPEQPSFMKRAASLLRDTAERWTQKLDDVVEQLDAPPEEVETSAEEPAPFLLTPEAIEHGTLETPLLPALEPVYRVRKQGDEHPAAVEVTYADQLKKEVLEAAQLVGAQLVNHPVVEAGPPAPTPKTPMELLQEDGLPAHVAAAGAWRPHQLVLLYNRSHLGVVADAAIGTAMARRSEAAKFPLKDIVKVVRRPVPGQHILSLHFEAGSLLLRLPVASYLEALVQAITKDSRIPVIQSQE